jgi:hypothetical protein
MGDAYQWRTQMYLAWMPIVDEKSRVVYEPTEVDIGQLTEGALP